MDVTRRFNNNTKCVPTIPENSRKKKDPAPTPDAPSKTSQATVKAAPMIAGAAQSIEAQSWLSDPVLLVGVGVCAATYILARVLRR